MIWIPAHHSVEADEHFALLNTLLLGDTFLQHILLLNTFCFLEHYSPFLLLITLCFLEHYANL